jgi:hypothetical protein
MLRVALVLTTTVILAACGSAPPKPSVDYAADFNFGGVTKIGLYALSGKTSGDNPMGLTDFQKDRISDALSRALQGRGFEIVDNAADAQLLLSWHLNAVEKQDIRTTTTPGYGMGVGMGVGYSRYNRYAMYSCYSCFDNTEVRVSDYTQGTFIVDMIDPVQNKSVWRSVTQSKLKGEALKDQATIDNGARIVLQGFPPGSAPTAD